MNVLDAGAWRGRRVLVTGNTGFKGAWLSLWLERLGATTFGIALPPPRGGAYEALRPKIDDEVFCDIRDRNRIADLIHRWRPELVFHLAAQPLVLEGYRDPVGTFDINVTGTVNVLSASAAAYARVVVVVTSDKVYRNSGTGRLFNESDPLGGHDPYSASKACADIATRSFRSLPEAAGVGIAVARAGNVIGGGDVATERLLPDAWRAITGGAPLELRSPAGVRPWQFVLEPLWGYLLLADRLMTDPSETPDAFNFGPPPASCRSVRDVVDLAFLQYGEGSWTTAADVPTSEASLLRIDASLACRVLGWAPLLGLEVAIARTVDWWKYERTGKDLRALGLSQLDAFMSSDQNELPVT